MDEEATLAAYNSLHRCRHLRQAIHSMQQQQLDEIVRAHDVHGWTFREIGESMQLAHSQVYHLWQQGKEKTRGS